MPSHAIAYTSNAKTVDDRPTARNAAACASMAQAGNETRRPGCPTHATNADDNPLPPCCVVLGPGARPSPTGPIRKPERGVTWMRAFMSANLLSARIGRWTSDLPSDRGVAVVDGDGPRPRRASDDRQLSRMEELRWRRAANRRYTGSRAAISRSTGVRVPSGRTAPLRPRRKPRLKVERKPSANTSEHIIHKAEGTIGSRNSYGGDPHPPKG